MAPANVFRTSEVARILGTTPQRVRTMVRFGLERPARRGRALEFGFQDLVLLRAAHGLLKAEVPPRRVWLALAELARQLPASRPVSGVRIYADGRQVVARDGRAAWQPDSGQVVFSFAVDELARRAGVVVPVACRRKRRAAPLRDPRDEAMAWFDLGLAQEEKDPAAAGTAYRRALECDPKLSDAYINLGRLAHEGGDSAAAAHLYRQALQCDPIDPIGHYNLALALEDQRDTSSAVFHYQRAVAIDPVFADAHFNLGRLLERLGRHTQAIRHLLRYKKLSGDG
jgi:tetratricopeptide (TPR) repeat protein